VQLDNGLITGLIESSHIYFTELMVSTTTAMPG